MIRKNTKKYSVKLKAGVIVRHRGCVLLIRELNNRTGRYGWNIIKGTFEPGRDRSILETAIREAREEAGAKIKLRHLLVTYYLLDKSDALMMFTFIADLIDKRVEIAPRELQTKYRVGENIIEVRFFTKQELTKLKSKDFIGKRAYLVIQEYLQGKKFPLDIIKTLPSK